MAKLLIVISVFLVVSVAFAHPTDKDENQEAVTKCVDSIVAIKWELKQKRDETIELLYDEDSVNAAKQFYLSASLAIKRLVVRVVQSEEDMEITTIRETFGGNVIWCSDHFSEEAYDIYYRAWKGMDQLVKMAGQQ